MKHKILFLALLIFFSLQISAKKIALISAISNYENIYGLHTEKDVEYVKASLIKQGFKEENILVITDEKVTRLGLIKAFKTALIDKAEKGDVAFFHFSGHGQQIMDDNGDEIDGYDEALVCYGAMSDWDDEEYKGEEHFRDDDLNKLLTELRKKIGANGSVLVMIDACFSGTMSRGNEIVRGSSSAIAPYTYEPVLKVGILNPSGLEMSEDKNMAKFILFSASKQDEVNYETKNEKGESVGSLSYAFAKAINGKNHIKTYRGLFDNIKLQMSITVPRQTPLADGAINTKLFGGELVEYEDYFRITKVADNKITVNAGLINGLNKGTILGLYPIETQKRNVINRKTKAEVIKISDFEAEIKLDKSIPKSDILKSWVFVEEESYGDMKVNIFVDEAVENRKKIIKTIEEHPIITIVSKNKIQKADIIIKGNKTNNGKYILNYEIKNDNNKYSDIIANNELELVTENIKKEVLFYSKAKYLRQLELKNPDLDVVLELLPVSKYKETDRGYLATEFGTQESKTTNGQVKYKKGDLFVFKIQNKSKKAVYFQIMDIMPNNAVAVLIPEDGVNEGDVKIEGEQTIVFASKIMQIGKPFGLDMFKIIVSPEPMYNLRNIIENKKGTRGRKSPFEILSQNIIKGTRGKASVPVNTVNTHSVIIKTSDK